MRKEFTPQVETREISDSDLDNVSGGVSVSGGVAVDGVGDLLDDVTAALPLGHVVGLVTGATGTLSGVTGVAGL
jgi:hypothetical protein